MADTQQVTHQQLQAMRLPELRELASQMGLRGISTLRKGPLLEVIEEAQRSGTSGWVTAPGQERPRRGRPRKAKEEATDAVADTTAENTAETTEAAPAEPAEAKRAPRRRRVQQQANQTEATAEQNEEAADAAAQDADAEANNDDAGNGRHMSRSAARRARRNRARQDDSERGNKRGERKERADRTKNEERADNADERVENTDERAVEADDADNRPEGRQEGRGRNRRNNREEQDERRNRRNSRSRRDNNERGNNERGNNEASEREDIEERSENAGQDRRNNREERNNREDRKDSQGGERRNRRNRRGRDNAQDSQNQGNNQGENSRDEEQLQLVAGILDVVDNNVAFVRTSGYHPGPADVYVSPQLVRRCGLRSGDSIVGYARVGGGHNNRGNNRGRQRQKYNPLVRIETVNEAPVEEARQRPQFAKLTPLYPNQRLRLETDPKVMTTRVIDLVMPIGKGQRALIVSPPKAGKTTILQDIANAISRNNPECYLMVVLIDERPEEVTDMTRNVNGEVIASTFDRPPSEHTAVAELAIERAKRLVEEGKDVVVLLDSITRLGRAYNNSSPASGRILSGGVDSNALYPPKRFLGAARNIEDGGSLTIIATAMVETGSAGDTVIFEEFKGTGNAELKLDRRIAERRVFPAVDINPSGTRKDDLLLAPEEARVMQKLRNLLSNMESDQAIDVLLKQLKKTKSNGEFLLQILNSAPMTAAAEEE